MNSSEENPGVLKLLQSGLFLLHSLHPTSESASVILMDSQLKTVMKRTIYLTLTEEPAMKMHFAAKWFFFFF